MNTDLFYPLLQFVLVFLMGLALGSYLALTWQKDKLLANIEALNEVTSRCNELVKMIASMQVTTKPADEARLRAFVARIDPLAPVRPKFNLLPTPPRENQ